MFLLFKVHSLGKETGPSGVSVALKNAGKKLITES